MIIKLLVSGIETIFLAVPPLVIIVLVFILVWFVANRGLAIGTAIGLFLIQNMQLWEASIETLALILASTALALVMGIPLGILTARSDFAHKLMMPLLDFMQTMPAFVYLIPAVLFFGLGQASGLFATVIFAMPPTIRLTGLGIRQVAAELVEAADAFGSTEWQKLVGIHKAPGPAYYYGRCQPMHHAFSIYGRHCGHDWGWWSGHRGAGRSFQNRHCQRV
ncbi:MAG: ABC transporter permease subunit [Candidatus Syntrophopropionicum ammoniitolerans]